jgi:hypothetical protein
MRYEHRLWERSLACLWSNSRGEVARLQRADDLLAHGGDRFTGCDPQVGTDWHPTRGTVRPCHEKAWPPPHRNHAVDENARTFEGCRGALGAPHLRQKSTESRGDGPGLVPRVIKSNELHPKSYGLSQSTSDPGHASGRHNWVTHLRTRLGGIEDHPAHGPSHRSAKDPERFDLKLDRLEGSSPLKQRFKASSVSFPDPFTYEVEQFVNGFSPWPLPIIGGSAGKDGRRDEAVQTDALRIAN